MNALFSADLTGLQEALLVAILAAAVVTDVRRRRIYNALTFPAMAAGLVAGGIADGPAGVGAAIAGLALGAALFAMPVAFLGRGAGDLKLLAAVGALGGPVYVIWSALLTGVAGAVFAVAVLLAQRSFVLVVGGMALDAVSGQLPVAKSNIRLPYAIPIAAGTIATLVLL